MFSKIKKKFMASPTAYYSLSIAASWAGAGSLMNATTLARTLGVVPAAIWCLCNTLACILFGLVIWKLPTVRAIIRTKACKMVLALFSIFQVWLCMTALHEAWATTPIGSIGGRLLAYAVALIFIIALYRMGIITNILTDNGGMYLIYILVAVLAGVSLVTMRGNAVPLALGLETGNILQGIYKGILLLPGPFVYQYFYRLIDYNEQNGDRVVRTDIIKAFIYGGLAFGVYLLFAFALVFTEVSPALNICKAVLLSALSISSLSTFIYSIFNTFGKKLGAGVNLFAVAFWIAVAPLGVMGVWTLMSEIRIYLVAAILAAALIKRRLDKRKGVPA